MRRTAGSPPIYPYLPSLLFAAGAIIAIAIARSRMAYFEAD
jgi:hypothetical protein